MRRNSQCSNGTGGRAYHDLIGDCRALVAAAADAAGSWVFDWRGRRCDPFAEPEVLTVCEAFERHASIDLAALLGDRDGLARAAAEAGIRITPDDTWHDVFSKIISKRSSQTLALGE